MNESEYQYGRSVEGTALLWRKDVLHNVNTYSITESGRPVALSFYSNKSAYIIFNLYMPCHSNSNEEQSMQVLEFMSFIDYVIDDVLKSGAKY